ncbi:MAG TPA: DUF3221 domain-containing protein [Anaerolineae bacterium]|nr:DUF3221 domain-containing protein [Anaerolineae bacterium]HMR65618.1 DUF3221 domain-containing protein [Anaerolineae bacterium]
MKQIRWSLLVWGLGLLGLLSACGPAPAVVPATNPAIRGGITNHQVSTGPNNDILGSILIEGQVESDTSFDKAAVTITAQTRIYEQLGQERRSTTFEALRVGQRVEAWFDGPVAESYPVQARASDVVILN